MGISRGLGRAHLGEPRVRNNRNREAKGVKAGLAERRGKMSKVCFFPRIS